MGNPKAALGVLKTPMSLVPSTAVVHAAEAMRDGATKYGPYNWRETGVTASIYIDAAERHIRSWFDGEDLAEDSGVHHLAHAMACLAILLDGEACEVLDDDRPSAGATGYLIKELARKA